jgi:hypothetical protein
MIPRPPFEEGSVRESHFTFARVLIAFPPQMKFRITPPNLITQSRIRVPVSYHVPHGGE